MKKHIKRSVLLVLVLLVILSSAAAGASDSGTPEAVAASETSERIEIALVIGGRDITNGRGFLKNVVYFTANELDELRDKSSGVTTYKYGLGDSWLASSQVFSAYEMHGESVWAYRRVLGIDIEAMAKALGVNTNRNLAVTATAGDGYSFTLEDAFNFSAKRYYINPQGALAQEIKPVLAFYETVSSTFDPPSPDSTHGIPAEPKTGAGSTDAVAPIFGYGQTGITDENNCHWVKLVNKLRIGSEDAAARATDTMGKTVSSSVSSIILNGLFRKSFTYGSDVYSAAGQPLSVLLSGMGVPVSEGQVVTVSSAAGTKTIRYDELAGCFVAWEATVNGGAVENTTALMLFMPDGTFGGIESFKVESSAPEQDAFSDLSGFDWAKPAINYLYSQGVVTGYDGKYNPGSYITRGDFILMLARAYKLEAQTYDNFADVPVGSYYYDAIAAARALGIAKGSGGNFQPTERITRQDAFTLLYRTLEVCGIEITVRDSLSAFSDAESISAYALDAVRALVAADIVTGSGGRINPNANMTRAEMAQVLYKALINL